MNPADASIERKAARSTTWSNLIGVLYRPTGQSKMEPARISQFYAEEIVDKDESVSIINNQEE